MVGFTAAQYDDIVTYIQTYGTHITRFPVAEVIRHCVATGIPGNVHTLLLYRWRDWMPVGIYELDNDGCTIGLYLLDGQVNA
jgi:hypothetical protein